MAKPNDLGKQNTDEYIFANNSFIDEFTNKWKNLRFVF